MLRWDGPGGMGKCEYNGIGLSPFSDSADISVWGGGEFDFVGPIGVGVQELGKESEISYLMEITVQKNWQEAVFGAQ